MSEYWRQIRPTSTESDPETSTSENEIERLQLRNQQLKYENKQSGKQLKNEKLKKKKLESEKLKLANELGSMNRKFKFVTILSSILIAMIPIIIWQLQSGYEYKLQSCEDDNYIYIRNLQDKPKELQAFEEQINQLESKNRRLETENQKHKNDLQEQQKELQASEGQINQLESKNRRLETENQKHKNDLQEKQKELQANKKECNKFSDCKLLNRWIQVRIFLSSFNTYQCRLWPY